MAPALDDFDRRILDLVQRDNRLTIEAIGERVGLSATAVQRRLKRLRDAYKPEYLAAVFESLGPTFRDEAFAGYKANRAETPPDLLDRTPTRRASHRPELLANALSGWKARCAVGVAGSCHGGDRHVCAGRHRACRTRSTTGAQAIRIAQSAMSDLLLLPQAVSS